MSAFTPALDTGNGAVYRFTQSVRIELRGVPQRCDLDPAYVAALAVSFRMRVSTCCMIEAKCGFKGSTCTTEG